MNQEFLNGLSKHRGKKVPGAGAPTPALPMKLRSLPQSFWEQPNRPAGDPPGSVLPQAPPLLIQDPLEQDEDSMQSFRSLADSMDYELYSTSPFPEGYADTVVTPADTELLFSLFHTVEKLREHQEIRSQSKIKRLKPRKIFCKPLKDEDPYLGNAAEKTVLAKATIENSRNYAQILSELVVQL